VKNGAYTSVSEIFRDALRLWEHRQAEETERLRRAWKEGIESGPSTTWDMKEFLAEMHARKAREAKGVRAKAKKARP